MYILSSVTPRCPVHALLLKSGPLRASKLAAQLVDANGISPETARQRLSRARPPVAKLPVSLLPKNEGFLYLDHHKRSEAFWEALIRALRDSNSVYGIALYGLIARGGVAQTSSFNVTTGSPKALRNHVSQSRLLENLLRVGLVETVAIGDLGECVRVRNGFEPDDANQFRARALAEEVLMDGLSEWVRKLGFASYFAINIRNDGNAPDFGSFNWDLRGPSYLLPLTTEARDTNKPKSGFFVADVFCTGILDTVHIQYFLRKVQVLKTMRKIVPFIPLLLAEGYTLEAFRAGRQSGVVMATTQNLFGDTVADAMKSLIRTLAQAAAVAARDPDRLIELLRNLKAIEGSAANLRGALFELIVGYLVREVEGASIDIGVQIRDLKTQEQTEIDVRRVKERRECWFYECKAQNPKNLIDSEVVTKWISRIDLVTRHHRAQERFRSCRLGFELWTNGDFDEEALQILRDEQTRRRKTVIKWRNGSGVREYAKKAAHKPILDTLDEHYFRRAWIE